MDKTLSSTERNLIYLTMAWEDGELDLEDEAMLFQYLIDMDYAWSLQGMYGRRATELIDCGICHEKGSK